MIEQEAFSAAVQGCCSKWNHPNMLLHCYEQVTPLSHKTSRDHDRDQLRIQFSSF